MLIPKKVKKERDILIEGTDIIKKEEYEQLIFPNDENIAIINLKLIEKAQQWKKQKK